MDYAKICCEALIENAKLRKENEELKRKLDSACLCMDAAFTIAEDFEEDIKRLEALLIEDREDDED